MKTGWIFTAAAVAAAALAGCREKGGREPGPAPGDGVAQVAIPRIEKMDNMPVPYKIIDWKRKALEFDNYAFDFDSSMPAGPIIWLDDAQRNVPQQTFGQYTAIHDVRQGPEANGGEFHESLTSLAAILGGGLNGIDKTNQNGYNFVKMVQNYFNSDNGWNIVMNNTNPDVANLGGGIRARLVVRRPAQLSLLRRVGCLSGRSRRGGDTADGGGAVLPCGRGAGGELRLLLLRLRDDDAARQSHSPAAGRCGRPRYVLYSAYRKFGDERYLEGGETGHPGAGQPEREPVLRDTASVGYLYGRAAECRGRYRLRYGEDDKLGVRWRDRPQGALRLGVSFRTAGGPTMSADFREALQTGEGTPFS